MLCDQEEEQRQRDHGGCRVYVVDAFAKKIEPSAKCFRAPSMSEGMTTFGGLAVLLYESGADDYAKPKPRNVIKHLHVATIATLPYFQAG
ncbi:hypothetical protein E1288_31820 [Saccharopolyspora elongata]|uniref:Uncharacterized protein n=1 Tax=Saccharopolyspora elongata TaxID=2530387 RepID=A0A4R4YAN4_9PSEU|nr:hypothetical protein E1288_31820 [Saccharopolyspora elongata]